MYARHELRVDEEISFAVVLDLVVVRVKRLDWNNECNLQHQRRRAVCTGRRPAALFHFASSLYQRSSSRHNFLVNSTTAFVTRCNVRHTVDLSTANSSPLTSDYSWKELVVQSLTAISSWFWFIGLRLWHVRMRRSSLSWICVTDNTGLFNDTSGLRCTLLWKIKINQRV